MPTRNISLTAEQDAFVEKLVNAGEYQNASEALRDALRALEQRRREDDLKLKALRVQIKAGIDAIKRGDFAEIEEADLQDYLERVKAPRQRSRWPMARFRLAGPAQADLANILAASAERWGTEGRRRYVIFSMQRCE
jgi:antitoxin ParD1/3/4